MFMLSKTMEIAGNVEQAMQKVYQQTEIEFNTYVSAISSEGAKIIG